MVRVKICGLTRLEDAALAVSLGAWALGFIFYPKSPRYIAPEAVRAILQALPGRENFKAVGVFVNADAASIRATVATSGIDTVQLHGDESPEAVRALSELSIFKAFRIARVEQLAVLPTYEDLVSAFLFDAAVEGAYGGTGQLSNWDLLASVRSPRPLIVSGGLHADNARAAYERLQPYALDLSSGVESRPGIKDHAKLQQLFQKLGDADDVRT